MRVIENGPRSIYHQQLRPVFWLPRRDSFRNELTNFTWYTPVPRSIRVKDGTGVPVFGDQHPDPMAEKVRWLICEGEATQADGRARGVNRNADHPLDIDRLYNVVLEDAVDEVVEWEKPNLLWETIVDGVMLTSPVDLVKVWPDLWPNIALAKRTIADGAPALPSFVEITYQPVGPKMKPRIAYFDLSLIPEPRHWLERRLGPLKPL